MTGAALASRARRNTRLRLAAAACVVAFGTTLLARWPLGDGIAVAVGLAVGAAWWWHSRAAARDHQRLIVALDAMEAGVVLYDDQDRLLLANADFRRLYDVPGAELRPGMSFEDLLRTRVRAGQVPEAAGREASWIAERVAQHRNVEGRSFLRRMADGRWRRITEQRLSDGGSLGFSIDVTEMVEQQHAAELARRDAQDAHALLSDAVEALPEGFALYDRDDRFVLCNENYRELYAASAPALVPGATFESVLRYGLVRGQYPQAAADPEAWLAERLRRHRETDGTPILQELPGNRWLRIDERRTREGGIAGVRTDVTELVRTREALEHANEELTRLSTTDALTGVLNRRGFDEHLDAEHRRAQRHNTELALLLVDVDHFKRFNDHHGHPAGDAALQRVAAALAPQARRPGERVARFGGEEFALVLPHCDAGTAALVAQRCLDAVMQADIAHGDSPLGPRLTLSIGGACAREGGSVADLIARADAQLYRAKQAGRARSCIEPKEEHTR